MTRDRVVRFSVDRPRTTIALVAAVTVLLGAFLPRMKLDTDPKNMLARTAPVRLSNDEVDRRFDLPANTIVVGVIEARGIFRPATLERLFALTRRISALPGVSARKVASLSTVSDVVASGGGLEVRPPLGPPPLSEAEAAEMRTRVLANPLFVGRLVSADGTTAAIYVPVEREAEGALVASGIRRVLREMAMPERVHVAGDPIVSESLAVEVFRQLGTLSPIAGLLMVLALLALFRSAATVVAVMSVSMLSMVWAMGLHVALGYTVHLMSAMIPVFLMAIATDSIHIFNEVGFRLGGGMGKRQAIVAGMQAVGRPVMFSDLTTAAGFAALALTEFPIIRVFGIFVAVGTLAILVLSFTFIPALLALADEGRLRAAGARDSHALLSGRALAALSRLALGRRRGVVLGGLILLGVAGVGMARLRVNNNMVEWFGRSSAVRVADRALGERLGGTAPGSLVVTGADGLFKQPEGLRLLEGLEAELAHVPGVSKVVSLADAVKQANMVLHGGAEGQRTIPDAPDSIAQILLLLSSGSRPADLDNLVDYSLGSAHLSLQLATWDVSAMRTVIARAQAYLARHPRPAVGLQPAGIATFNLVWNEKVLVGMAWSFASGLAIVLLLLFWEYRSAVVGAVVFLPLLFTTALLYGAIGLAGKDFDMPISVLSTLTLGLAIDFAIHFVSRLQARLEEGAPFEEALAWTVQRPGLGIVRNALVFSLGFVVMAFAGFSPYVTVGIFMAAIMLLSSLATLLFLPALFRLFPGLIEGRRVPRALVRSAVVVVILLASAGAQAQGAPDSDEIARRSLLATYYPGKDFRAKVTMRLVARNGQVRERQVTMLRKNVGAAGGDQRYFIYFQKPEEVRRTAFLVLKHPDRDDDRWLFLPAVDLVRRIAASDRRSSFVGSDFSYEDISGRDLAADSRQLLRTEKVGAADCYVLESRPRADAEYGRKLAWIDVQSFLPRREEYYEPGGALYKVFTADTVALIKGLPTITRRTMKDVNSGHLTTVEISAVDYDVGIDDDVFSERYLRRPPGRWLE
jgi:predicted RND superfamily exporter protein/outer membrane lipoprotein-sorting protein